MSPPSPFSFVLPIRMGAYAAGRQPCTSHLPLMMLSPLPLYSLSSSGKRSPRHHSQDTLHFMSATVSTISGQLRKAKIGAIELEAPLGIGTMFWGESFVDSLFGPIPPFQDLK